MLNAKKIANLESLWGFLASSVFGYFSWYLSATSTPPIHYLWGFMIWSVTATWVAGILYLNAKESLSAETLQIKPSQFRKSPQSPLPILLVHPTPQLSHGSFVTIFREINEFEHYLATGKVSNIQGNGLIAIQLVHYAEISENELLSNSETLIKSMSLKPTLSEIALRDLRDV